MGISDFVEYYLGMSRGNGGCFPGEMLEKAQSNLTFCSPEGLSTLFEKCSFISELELILTIFQGEGRGWGGWLARVQI